MSPPPEQETFTIQDLETLKVIADPLRAQIFEVLIAEPLTIKQVGEKLGLAASKLYYHINMMEKHSLITMVDSRVVANLIEKVYQASAIRLEVDPALFTFSTFEGKENINTWLSTTLDTTREDVLRSLQARTFELEQGGAPDARRVTLARLVCRIPEARADEFRARLDALMHDFAEADVPTFAPDDGLQNYALTVVFYPTLYFQSDRASESDDQ